MIQRVLKDKVGFVKVVDKFATTPSTFSIGCLNSLPLG